jgi:hypothetical protein
MAVIPENWRWGEITEDKKLPVRFLDANGDPIALASLYGYGVEVFTKRQSIIKCGKNIEGYEDACLIDNGDGYTITVVMDGDLLPQSNSQVFAMTTIVIVDPDMEDGYFTDHCETIPVVYNAMDQKRNSL